MLNKLLKHFSELGYVDESNDKIVSLGLRRLGNTLMDFLFSLVCALFMGKVSVGIVFEIFYAAIRVYAGGYHASSEKICKYLTYCSTLVSMLIIFYLPIKIDIIHIILIICLVVIAVIAPVENENKPLNRKERKVYYQKCIGIAILEVLFYFLMVYIKNFLYARAICMAMVLVVTGLIVEIIRKRFK